MTQGSINNIVLTGDINLDISELNKHKNKDWYLNLTASYGLMPAYYTPTRQNTCLDHVLLKCANKATVVKLETQITDHIPSITSLELNDLHRIKNNTITILDTEAIACDIKNLDFSTILDSTDVNFSTNTFIDLIGNAIKKPH